MKKQINRRPAVGQDVNLVLLGKPEVSVVCGKVLFDRGRGLILDLEASLEEGERGRPVLIVYVTEGDVLYLKGTVSEVVTAKRVYVMPTAEPRQMDKREYIRALFRLPCALTTSPGSTPVLKEVDVELSASGFRFFGGCEAEEGDRVWLHIGLPTPKVLSATILRKQTKPGRCEVAGVFADLTPQDREELFRLVFVKRLEELGIKKPDL